MKIGGFFTGLAFFIGGTSTVSFSVSASTYTVSVNETNVWYKHVRSYTFTFTRNGSPAANTTVLFDHIAASNAGILGFNSSYTTNDNGQVTLSLQSTNKLDAATNFTLPMSIDGVALQQNFTLSSRWVYLPTGSPRTYWLMETVKATGAAYSIRVWWNNNEIVNSISNADRTSTVVNGETYTRGTLQKQEETTNGIYMNYWYSITKS